MSTKGVLSSPEDTAEERLMRYLYIGKEHPVYHPGNWFVHKYYVASNIPSIEELAADKEKETLPVELIIKAHQQADLVQNPETLVFALAVCAKQKTSEKLRTAAYNNVSTVCKSSQYFLLFIKFANQLSQEQSEPKHGYGHGWRKAVNNWYNSKTPLELAKCVTQCKGRYGWKHKDIIKLSHYTPTSEGLQVVMKYIMHGFEKAKQLFLEPNEEISEIIKCIESTENFRHCDDEVKAGCLVETQNFTLDHVPGHLLKSEEVWTSLANSMNVCMLLENLQRIHNLGFFKSDTPILAKVLDSLASKEKIASESVQPALVLITIKNYENSGKPLSFEQRKVKQEAKRQLPLPHKPNEKLLTCLYKTLDASLSNVKPTGLRYLITINMNKASLNDPTWHNSNVKVAEAACIIALSLRSENITIVTFKNLGIHTVNLDKTVSFGESLERLQQFPVGSVNCDKPMTWASAQNKEIDVFVNIVDQASQRLNKSEEGIKNYRKKMNLPKAKLVNCAMCASSTYLKEKYDKTVLNICGFDASVPKIIEAFSKSLF